MYIGNCGPGTLVTVRLNGRSTCAASRAPKPTSVVGAPADSWTIVAAPKA